MSFNYIKIKMSIGIWMLIIQSYLEFFLAGILHFLPKSTVFKKGIFIWLGGHCSNIGFIISVTIYSIWMFCAFKILLNKTINVKIL